MLLCQSNLLYLLLAKSKGAAIPSVPFLILGESQTSALEYNQHSSLVNADIL